MVIAEIQENVKTAVNPVAKIFHKMPNSKVLIMGFNQGMKLKEHTAHLPTKLLVISGKVVYIEGNKSLILKQYDETDIAVEVKHEVEALEDSLCLLTQG